MGTQDEQGTTSGETRLRLVRRGDEPALLAAGQQAPRAALLAASGQLKEALGQAMQALAPVTVSPSASPFTIPLAAAVQQLLAAASSVVDAVTVPAYDAAVHSVEEREQLAADSYTRLQEAHHLLQDAGGYVRKAVTEWLDRDALAELEQDERDSEFDCGTPAVLSADVVVAVPGRASGGDHHDRASRVQLRVAVAADGRVGWSSDDMHLPGVTAVQQLDLTEALRTVALALLPAVTA
ncbi:MAG: hypothetical protein H0X35_00490 [Pseudonocardiales bacterium]|nr:hypothetical protein [Pseudonocardiales bacterium]